MTNIVQMSVGCKRGYRNPGPPLTHEPVPKAKLSRIWVLLSLAAAVSLGISACGGGDKADQSSPSAASRVFDSNGGVVVLEPFSLRVGSDVIPEGQTAKVTLRRGARLDEALKLNHPPDTYRAVGTAVEVDVPFQSDRPAEVVISWHASDLPEGFKAENLMVFGYGPTVFDPLQQTSPQADLITENDFAPMYTEVDIEAETATANVYESGVLQLVSLGSPMDVQTEEEFESASALVTVGRTSWQKLVPGAGPTVVIDPSLAATLSEAEKENVRAVLRNALQKSSETYELMGFVTPPMYRVVIVASGSVAQFAGKAFSTNPYAIFLNPTNVTADQAGKIIAHEYFHLVEFWNTNDISMGTFLHQRDHWLIEGAAEWARDIVYDDVVDQYQAPNVGRFQTPLNKPGDGTQVPDYVYQTVAFWKWLEVKYPGTLSQTFNRVRNQALKVCTDWFRLQNPTLVSYNDTLRDVRPEVDLQSFFEDVVYYKDFDRDEVRAKELWDRLGQERDVEVSVRLVAIVMARGGPGDGELLPLPLTTTITPSLTAYPRLIQNATAPDDLEGTIHIEFQPTNPNLAATVISRDTDEKKRVSGLTEPKEVTFPFRAGTEIVVIPMDPQWKPPGSGTTTMNYEVWVEPESECGPLTGTVHRVERTSDLLPTLAQASEGDTVLLAPGVYTVRTSDLPTLPYFQRGAWLIDKELTLAGSGPEATEIVLPDTNDLMWAWDNAHTTFRDFKVRTVGTTGFSVGGVERLTFCNVLAEFVQNANYGVLVYTNWPDIGQVSQIEVIDSVFSGPDPRQLPTTGFSLSSSGGEPPADVTFRSHNSRIGHWLYGLYYRSNEPGAPNVTLDIHNCAETFSNIDGFNACQFKFPRCAEMCAAE